MPRNPGRAALVPDTLVSHWLLNNDSSAWRPAGMHQLHWAHPTPLHCSTALAGNGAWCTAPLDHTHYLKATCTAALASGGHYRLPENQPVDVATMPQPL